MSIASGSTTATSWSDRTEHGKIDLLYTLNAIEEGQEVGTITINDQLDKENIKIFDVAELSM